MIPRPMTAKMVAAKAKATLITLKTAGKARGFFPAAMAISEIKEIIPDRPKNNAAQTGNSTAKERIPATVNWVGLLPRNPKL